MSANVAGILGISLALTAAFLGFRLHARYRAAIEYKGIGRPYSFGSSALAFAGIALMILGIAAAGVMAMVTFVWKF